MKGIFDELRALTGELVVGIELIGPESSYWSDRDSATLDMWTLISELVKIWIISHNFKSCPFYVVNLLRNLDNTFWRYCTKFTDSKAMYWFSFSIVPHNLLFQYLPTNHEPCIINVTWYVLSLALSRMLRIQHKMQIRIHD